MIRKSLFAAAACLMSLTVFSATLAVPQDGADRPPVQRPIA